MDAPTARLLVGEIAPRVEGARIVAVAAPGPESVVLELAGKRRLFFGAVTMKALPILFVSDSDAVMPARGRGEGPASQLKGATVLSLTNLEPGPGAVLRVSWTSQAGRTVERALVIDMGRRPRLLLRDEPPGSGGASTTPAQDAPGGDSPGGDSLGGGSPGGAPAPTVAWWHDSSGRLHARLSAEGEEKASEGSESFGSLAEAAAFMFERFWPELDGERRRGALEKVISRRLRRTERAMEKVQSEIDDSDRADEYRHKGQLVLTRQDSVQRGSTSVTVPDYDNVTMVTIEIDPKLGPQQNAEAFFRRARKAERRSERAPVRMGELEEKAESLKEAAAALEGAAEGELAALEQRFLPKQARPAARKESSERARFRTYHISGGWEVLVGKSNRDNDILTHKIAKPSDLWFHARQAAGSHVVLKKSGQKAEPDKQAILEAAAIAAFHSKAGKSSKVSVCYTEKRHVRKVRGGQPGLAIVAREKVVMVKPKLPAS